MAMKIKSEVSILISIKKCSIIQAKPGMKLGKSIMAENGMVLLDKDVILTDKLIAKLAYWKISKIFVIQEEMFSSFDDRKDERREFVAERDKMIVAVSEIFDQFNEFGRLSVAHLHEFIDETLMPLLFKSNSVFSYVHVINHTGDYLFRHSINVAIFAGILGKWLGWTESQIKQLVTAGLLHDIGKVRIPLTILNKPDQLTYEEMEVMKQHALFGYEILQGADDIDEIVKTGILQHHERLDGSGYPSSLQAGDISQVARIIAVVDIYDAMISQRVYHQAISPILAMKELYQTMFGMMDPKICMIFIQHAKKCLVGSLVKLSNGLIAKIIYLNEQWFTRPVVQTMTGQYISLEEEMEINIMEFVC